MTKASTVLNHFGRDFVAFGNDQNDISLFKYAIYSVQVGDYPYLKDFADEVIPAINTVIAEKLNYCLKSSKQMLRLLALFAVQ